jgi:hypothetical protein
MTTVVSSKEFATNQDKYLEMALNEHIFIKQGNNMFIVTGVNDEDEEDYADLEEAKARANDESTSADEFQQFLRGLRK